jgi:hypothetical protein
MSDKQIVLHAPFPLKFPEYPLFFISTTRLNIPEILVNYHHEIATEGTQDTEQKGPAIRRQPG